MSNLPTFLGTWNQFIDHAGGLALPRSFRRQLGDGVILTVGFERCLQVYSLAGWERLRGLVGGLPVGSAQARSLRRFLFANAAEVLLDEEGLLRVPPHLRTYADLSRAVVLVGMDGWFEIWSSERWPGIAEGLLNGHGATGMLSLPLSGD